MMADNILIILVLVNVVLGVSWVWKIETTAYRIAAVAMSICFFAVGFGLAILLYGR